MRWHSAKYEISGSQLTYISVYLSFKSHSANLCVCPGQLIDLISFQQSVPEYATVPRSSDLHHPCPSTAVRSKRRSMGIILIRMSRSSAGVVVQSPATTQLCTVHTQRLNVESRVREGDPQSSSSPVRSGERASDRAIKAGQRRLGVYIDGMHVPKRIITFNSIFCSINGWTKNKLHGIVVVVSPVKTDKQNRNRTGQEQQQHQAVKQTAINRSIADRSIERMQYVHKTFNCDQWSSPLFGLLYYPYIIKPTTSWSNVTSLYCLHCNQRFKAFIARMLR